MLSDLWELAHFTLYAYLGKIFIDGTDSSKMYCYAYIQVLPLLELNILNSWKIF